MKLPETFTVKMKALLKDEYEDYLASYHLPQYQGIRINTLKVDLEQWETINPFATLKEVPWCKEGFYYDKEEKPTKHPYYYAGLYYIQEPSAMSPGAYLPIVPGDRVLDLCAAPGGKSTQIAARMQGKGVLVSNDISASRAKALLKNLENFGARQAIVTSETSEKLASKWPGYFDKILIDAPCSGEGMFRKNETAVKSWENYGVDYCMKLQETILEDAATMLKPDGMLLYSTCTFSPEENEGMIGAFLKKHSDFKVVPLLPVGGIQEGKPEWIDAPASLKGALRLWPHHIEGEGHFVCLLKRENKNHELSYKPQLYKRLKDYSEAYAFLKEQTCLPEDLPVVEIKGKLYQVPSDNPPLMGIRVIRCGVLLGEIKNKRFDPGHALVLAYGKEMFKNTICYKSTDEEVIRYLKGETLLHEAHKGYHVICVDDQPLGWVKAQDGRLKNQYPATWRMV